MWPPVAVDVDLSICGVRVFTAVWKVLSGDSPGPCSPLRFLEVPFPAGSSWVCVDPDALLSHPSPFSCLCLGRTTPHMMGICKAREDAEAGCQAAQLCCLLFTLGVLNTPFVFCCCFSLLFFFSCSGESYNLCSLGSGLLSADEYFIKIRPLTTHKIRASGYFLLFLQCWGFSCM